MIPDLGSTIVTYGNPVYENKSTYDFLDED